MLNKESIVGIFRVNHMELGMRDTVGHHTVILRREKYVRRNRDNKATRLYTRQGIGHRATPARNVVRISRATQRQIGIGVEAFDKFPSLILLVALYLTLEYIDTGFTVPLRQVVGIMAAIAQQSD